jgi:hypothetical protein
MTVQTGLLQWWDARIAQKKGRPEAAFFLVSAVSVTAGERAAAQRC